MTAGPVRGVTVDLDDTLFPQQQWLDGAWEAVAARGAELGLAADRLLHALRAAASDGSDRGGIIDRALDAMGALDARGASVPPLVEAFTAHAPHRLVPYPGVLEALRVLSSDVPVVCVTDGNPRIQNAKLDALGLRRYLRAVVISDEIDLDGRSGRSLRKPHPAPFRRALDLLGVPAAQVVHIGDRPAKDLAGATAAGMRSVRVRTGEYADLPDDPHSPWGSVDSFAAAVGLVRRHVRGAARGTPAASVGL